LDLILICHPQTTLIDNDGHDWNAGYRRPEGARATLSRIPFDEIDFTKNKLIVASSWWRQPKPLTKCVERLLPTGRVQHVLWFQEALALARMRLGVAVVSEVYKNEKNINAFALSPENEFRRQIGIYYHAKKPFSLQACRLAAFIGEFLTTHEEAIRRGEPPTCGPEDQVRWEQFSLDQDWSAHRELHFPTRSGR
jgi:DNA-binding transcriptional LysR family regulator